MIDVEPLIESSFDRMLPVRPVAGDWADVLARAGVRGTRSSRRRRLGLGVVVTALVVTAGAVAAVKELPWWQSGSPPVDPQAVVSVARDNMPASVRVADARTVSTDGDAALVAVPLDQSGYCVIPALSGRASFGAQCVYAVPDPESGDGDTVESVIRPTADSQAGVWLVYGRIADPHAASVELGPVSVKLENGGFFLAHVPANQWQSLANTATAGQITDASGNTLRRGCITWGHSPSDGSATTDPNAFSWSDPTQPCRPQTLPTPPQVDYQRAQPLFGVTLTHSYSIWKPGETITFNEAPTSSGSSCVVLTGPGLTLAQAASEQHGFGCNERPPMSKDQPLTAEIGAQLAHENGTAIYAWDVSGWLDTQRVASVKLRTPDGTRSVATGDGFFFVQLPETTPGPATGSVPLPAGSFTLIGYDASGTEIAHLSLNDLQKNATPH